MTEVWMKVLLMMWRRLPRIHRSIGLSIDALVTRGFYGSDCRGLDSVALYERILKLRYRMDGIENLEALVNRLIEGIKEANAEVLRLRFLEGMKIQRIADRLGTNRRTVFRRIGSGIGQMTKLSLRMGYGQAWFDREYANEPFVMAVYRRVNEEKYLLAS